MPCEMARPTHRLWVGFGQQVRDARLAKRISARDLAARAGLSAAMLYRVEAGELASTATAERIASALGRRAELHLIDPRKREARPSLTADPVHSAMGEFEAGHLRNLGRSVGIDEPYQHYQFSGRADLVAWDIDAAALLHIENRTRFPDFQDMAGAFNAKKAYLGAAIVERLGIRRWASETHVIAALWSAEVLHAIRLRTQSFRSLCPDDPARFAAWWSGEPARPGKASVLVVIDPLADPSQRQWIDLSTALKARPRHSGYADAGARLAAIEYRENSSSSDLAESEEGLTPL